MSLKKTLAKALTGVALASSLYGLPAKKANAWEMVLPSGAIMVVPDETTQQSNQQTQQKHYNWIKPNKYSDWQCAYELIYNGNRPHGFRLYVDKDGDNKPDYSYDYFFKGYNAFYGGITYKFELDTSSVQVGGNWRIDGKKAMNVCGPEAIRRFFYESKYYSGNASDYKIVRPYYNIYYPKVTFEER